MRRISVSALGVLCTLALVAACDGITEPGQMGGVELAAAHTGIDGNDATSINGGGHIRDGDWDISFAGQVDETGGDWVIQFHNVSVAPSTVSYRLHPPQDGSERSTVHEDPA